MIIVVYRFKLRESSESRNYEAGGTHLLSTITEPNADDFLLHAERVGEGGDLLAGGLGVVEEGLLERDAHAGLDGGPLLAAAADGLGQPRTQRGAAPAAGQRRVCVLEPLLQERFQLAHIFKAQIESFETRYSRLREVVPVQLAHREAHVALGEACNKSRGKTESTRLYV